ncbi:MAG: universal stress protein [Elusimicrobia bacterium]|nr:universal stress protein [Elusimicrobiota bacterium]
MIFPARRILVPDDLTSASRRTWAWARRFAAPGACLESLFVYDPPITPILGLPAPELTEADEESLRERLRARRPGGSDYRVECGDPAFRILRRARHADLAVLGTHHRVGLSRALLGSVAEAVARDAEIPVLAVGAPLRRVSSVLAPVNGEPYAFAGLALAAQAAAFLGARLTVLNVRAQAGGEGDSRRLVRGLIERLPAAARDKTRPRVATAYGDPVSAILEESVRHGLVVLAARRKRLLSAWVLGGTVERVLRHSRVPVLSVPAHI